MQRKEEQLNHELQVALNDLKDENKEMLEEFNKTDTRINTFLAVYLGIISLDISLLSNPIKTVFEKYILEKQIIPPVCLSIIIIMIIIINIAIIINFRKSITISENRYTNREKVDEFINNKIKENTLLKQQIFKYQENIAENEKQLKTKKLYIQEGLNKIIISIILMIILLMPLYI